MPKAVSLDMQAQNRKRIVSDFFELVTQGRQDEGLGFFSPDCRQHNPYIRGGMKALFDGMAAAQKEAGKYPDPSFAVRSILVDGDMVAAHTELLASKSNPAEGGLRQVHIFRFMGDKIVEYFDITQAIQPDMPNAANAFQRERP
jgi:predicted SnoaL-like aldol condensation-catalyzing enzyme